MNKRIERIKELDLARGLAIIFMILVHLMYSVYDMNNTIVFKTIDFLGSPFAAVTFMFVMGANIALTKKDYKIFINRGIKLIIAGFLYNIICHVIPYAIVSYNTNDLIHLKEIMHYLLASDILTFAGFSFILFGILKKYKITDSGICVIALAMSFINSVLAIYIPINFENNFLLASITSFFYSSSTPGYFSLFGWFIFPAFGNMYMNKIYKYKDNNKVHLKVLIFSIIIYFIMLIISMNIVNGKPLIDFYDEYSYYRMHIYGGIMNVFFSISWINILYFIIKILPNKIFNFFQKLSINITNIYYAQWFSITYFFVIPFNNSLSVNTMELFISFIITLISTNIITYIIKKYKSL